MLPVELTLKKYGLTKNQSSDAQFLQAVRDEGLTQARIGERIGWSETQVKKYTMLINNIVPKILNLTKEHQEGRGTKKVPNVTFNFTEGWFRDSGRIFTK